MGIDLGAAAMTVLLTALLVFAAGIAVAVAFVLISIIFELTDHL